MDEIIENVRFMEFDSVCRFCLKRDVFLKPLFSEDDGVVDDFASDDGNGNESVSEMVELCMGIKITPHDKLPKFMCSKCLKNLLNCNRFRRQALRSQEILKKALKRFEDGQDDDFDSYDMFAVQEEGSYNHVFDMENIVEKDELEKLRKDYGNLFSSEPYRVDMLQDDWVKTNEVITDSSSSSEVVNEDLIFSQSEKGQAKSTIMLDNKSLTEDCETNQLTSNILVIKTPKRKRSVHRPKQCQICGTMTKGLKLHMLTHKGEKRRKCTYCKKCFSQRGKLKRRIDIHINNRKYKCILCKKSFTDSKSLKSDMVSHNGEKKFCCDICGKMFGDSHAVLCHKRAHL